MEISSASFAYPRHDGAMRAGLARRLLDGVPVAEGFVLSTCLRVEVAVPGSEAALTEVLRSLLGDPIALDPEIRVGEQAVTHLFRISAGLESPILGEQEILTQFRQTLIESEEVGHVSGLFARLLESAVGVGRQARDVLPGSPHNSMAAVAAQAIGQAERVAVFGSGVMATAVVAALQLLPAPPRVTVLARNPEKMVELPDVDVLPFEHTEETLQSFPAVISATSANHRILGEEHLSAAISRREMPLLLIDMAMPPDFRPSDRDAIIYIPIDELAKMADRRPRSESADAMVAAAAAEAYRQYRDHHEVGPLIGGLMSNADEIVDQTVRRFAGRLGDPADESLMRQAVHTVARTLLAGPVSYLKTEDRSAEAIDVIADAFGVLDV